MGTRACVIAVAGFEAAASRLVPRSTRDSLLLVPQWSAAFSRVSTWTRTTRLGRCNDLAADPAASRFPCEGTVGRRVSLRARTRQHGSDSTRPRGQYAAATFGIRRSGRRKIRPFPLGIDVAACHSPGSGGPSRAHDAGGVRFDRP
jgi:hypothetical protein